MDDPTGRFACLRSSEAGRVERIPHSGDGLGSGDLSGDCLGGECASRLGKPIVVEPFVPPWQVPALLSGLDGVFQVSNDDPIQSPSNLAAEARAMGARVITTTEDLA